MTTRRFCTAQIRLESESGSETLVEATLWESVHFRSGDKRLQVCTVLLPAFYPIGESSRFMNASFLGMCLRHEHDRFGL